jgi:DMSO reductase anchor subunit
MLPGGTGSGSPGSAIAAEEEQALSETVSNVLEEARMILPGTQTLFGFQLIVVFNARFHEELSPLEEYVHLGATMLVALATAMLIAPAAYHRIAEPETVSRQFVALSSQLLSWSLVPLALAICADFYLVASLVTANAAASIVLALMLFLVFGGLWFVLPGRAMNRRGRDGQR